MEQGDSSLVDACLRGDQRAWDELVARYKRLVYSIPFKYRLSPEDAEEVFQAVWLEAFTSLPRLRKTDNLRPWLMTVAAHQSFHLKQKRRRRGDREVEGDVEEQQSEQGLTPELVEALEREQLVHEALARLPERCRKLVLMLFFDDPPVPYAEVARRLGLATGSIGFIRQRCLKRLLQVLTEIGF